MRATDVAAESLLGCWAYTKGMVSHRHDAMRLTMVGLVSKSRARALVAGLQQRGLNPKSPLGVEHESRMESNVVAVGSWR